MQRPESCVSIPINLSGLAGFLFSLWGLRWFQPDLLLSQKVVVILLAISVPIVVLEFFFRRPSLLGRFAYRNKVNYQRVGIKLLALYVVYAAIAFIYWLFPEYQGSFYKPFWNLLLPVLPWLVLLAIPYFFLVDRRMPDPEDAYYHLGRYLLRLEMYDRQQIVQLLLGWLVKLFFLPLMVVYFSKNIASLLGEKYVFTSITQDFQHIYDFLWIMLFTIDLGFVCMGYMLTLRLLDSHIRSTEPTLLGWLAALICYQPFLSIMSSLYLAYNADNYSWGDWLGGHPVAYVIWGVLILFCLTVYTFSSVVFGIRFSNLTNRGIITNGPYRYFKHPAYLFKNISWWLVAIPFVSQSGNFEVVMKSCFLLILLNLVYYVRAKTEERHLSSDPVYQKYATWINDNGFFARLKRVKF